jgi:hypothetical protein
MKLSKTILDHQAEELYDILLRPLYLLPLSNMKSGTGPLYIIDTGHLN